jgi:hypothetical protein
VSSLSLRYQAWLQTGCKGGEGICGRWCLKPTSVDRELGVLRPGHVHCIVEGLNFYLKHHKCSAVLQLHSQKTPKKLVLDFRFLFSRSHVYHQQLLMWNPKAKDSKLRIWSVCRAPFLISVLPTAQQGRISLVALWTVEKSTSILNFFSESVSCCLYHLKTTIHNHWVPSLPSGARMLPHGPYFGVKPKILLTYWEQGKYF